MRKIALILALLILLSGCRLLQTKPQYELSLREERQLNQQRATAIESALEAYRRVHGYYPEGLDDLVPDLLDAVPVTVTGDPFEYKAYRLAYYDNAPDYILNYYPASKPDIVCGRVRHLYPPGYWDCTMKDIGDKLER